MKKFVILVILIISCFILYHIYKNNRINFFLKNIENDKISVDKYYIYGNHLNIEGSINKKFIDLKDVKLIVKSTYKEYSYDINYDTTSNFKFNINSNINNGINLEKLDNHRFYILLKFIYNDSVKYYGLKNKTNYKNTIYYSLNNYKKTIGFNNNMFIDSKIDDSFYDIVIDPGHGGVDSGAANGKYYESNLTLDYSKALKEKLSDLGYSVKLTRDSNIKINNYGSNSRTSIIHESKAKYLFSIHFNSSENYISYSGFEIYLSNNMNLEFASKLSKNMSTILNYSNNNSFKIKNGIYVRNMSQSDINSMKDEAIKNNYEPYKINTSTPYLFILRETGGIITNAFVDGRHNNKNLYYNSNIGPESYLLELGYINNTKDLKIILNNKDNYTNVLANAIDEYIKNNSN